jgi:tryptophanyl-tRNA synthetase
MDLKKKIALTGIKPTAMPHLGNYFGAIKPALELAKDYETYFFIADYHALNTIKKRNELHDLTYDIAASWLACGLNPKQEECYLYKQSDIPEICELETILLAFASKGLMNRAHAYKARVAENEEHNREPDQDINMGLYTYPVLMAADILLFDADIVPVGKDQLQHIEITRDIAAAVYHNYKK